MWYVRGPLHASEAVAASESNLGDQQNMDGSLASIIYSFLIGHIYIAYKPQILTGMHIQVEISSCIINSITTNPETIVDTSRNLRFN